MASRDCRVTSANNLSTTQFLVQSTIILGFKRISARYRDLWTKVTIQNLYRDKVGFVLVLSHVVLTCWIKQDTRRVSLDADKRAYRWDRIFNRLVNQTYALLNEQIFLLAKQRNYYTSIIKHTFPLLALQKLHLTSHSCPLPALHFHHWSYIFQQGFLLIINTTPCVRSNTQCHKRNLS